MKYKLLIIVFYLACVGFSQDVESAAKYVGAGAVFGAIGGYTASEIFENDNGWTWVGAIGGGLSAGIAKETYDASRGDKWRGEEVLYSTVGGAISGLFIHLLKNRSFKSKKHRGRKKNRNCGCLLVYSNVIESPIIHVNGLRDIEAQITAAGLYN